MMNSDILVYKHIHIAFVCDGFPIKSETFVTNQILNAVNNNFDVSIHVDSMNPETESALEKEVRSAKLMEKVHVNIPRDYRFFKRLISSLILVFKYRAFSVFFKSMDIRKFGKRCLNLTNFCSFSSLVSSQRPDLIHAHFGASGVKAINAKLCGLIDCPVITSFHGYDVHAKKENFDGFKRYYSKLFEVGDIFVVNGKFLKNQLKKLGCPSEKIQIIPIGVNVDYFCPNFNNPPPSKVLRLITTGRLIELKNQKIGILVLHLLRQKGINAIYTLIGSGPEEENLRDLASSLNVGSYVNFLGPLSQAEIVCELQKSHVFLMCSDVDSAGRAETQGIVTAEAQACGLPVITLGTGGTKETIIDGSTGYNVLSKNPTEIVDAILNIIEPSQYPKFSEDARLYVVEKYNITATHQEILAIYNTAVNSISKI